MASTVSRSPAFLSAAARAGAPRSARARAGVRARSARGAVDRGPAATAPAALLSRSSRSVAPAPLRSRPRGTSSRPGSRRGSLAPRAGYGGVYGRGPERGGIVPVPDRVVALLPYLVPLLDGLRYSRFFFAQFPQAIFLLQPLQPLASVYFRIPFAGMISFFAIYMGIAENRNLSRFVRFNGMQAIILDVCLVLPGMVEYVLSPSRLGGAALELYKLCYNFVWVFVLAAFCLAAVGCLTGQMYKLPFIGDAADMRI
jgi:uncharacterized membrane protein